MHDGAADLRGPGVLFTGVYGASGVPDYGEGALYYVVMSCTALLPGASSGPQETSRLEKSHAPSDTWETEAKSVAMRSKMSVLEKYSVSEEDMAAVLEVDPARLRQTMARKSKGAVVYIYIYIYIYICIIYIYIYIYCVYYITLYHIHIYYISYIILCQILLCYIMLYYIMLY